MEFNINKLNYLIESLLEEFLDNSSSTKSGSDTSSKTGPSNINSLIDNKTPEIISPTTSEPKPNLGGSKMQPVDKPETGSSVLEFGTAGPNASINDSMKLQSFADRYKAVSA